MLTLQNTSMLDCQRTTIRTMATADRIKLALKEAGVEDRAIRSTLASICGVSPQAVAQWFSGATKDIRPAHLDAIATAYGLSLHWLITGKGPMKKDAAEFEALFSGASSDTRREVIAKILDSLSLNERLEIARAALRDNAKD